MLSSDDVFIAIRNDDLGEIAIDLMNFNDELSELFSSIDSKMAELKSAFDSKVYIDLMNKYNSFKKNYSIVKNNITSYSDDLIAVINKVRTGDATAKSLFDSNTIEILEKAKLINNL